MLEQYRNKIDQIDEQILQLLNKRSVVVKDIGEWKKSTGMKIQDSSREAVVFNKVKKANTGYYTNDSLLTIYQTIINESKKIQD